MAITRERKEELVAEYSRLLSLTDGFIVTEYKSMTVAKMGDLRTKLSAESGTYSITKNTLFNIALRENNWPIPEGQLVGTTGIVFGNGNLPAVAKIVRDFAKDNADFFVVRGGVLAGSVFTAKEIEAVANLPTLEEIHAQLAGLVVQPASLLAGLLQSATSQVVNVLQAYLDDNKSEEEAA